MNIHKEPAILWTPPLSTHQEVFCDWLLALRAGPERGPPTPDPVQSDPSPTDLRFSELGSREVRLHWSGPAGLGRPVLQYRVVYHSAEGQSPQEVSRPPGPGSGSGIGCVVIG